MSKGIWAVVSIFGIATSVLCALEIDEIGASRVTQIKNELKEPFLNLLASSEFINSNELDNRLLAVEKALESFKKEFHGQVEQTRAISTQEGVLATIPVENQGTVSVPTVPPTESVSQQVSKADVIVQSVGQVPASELVPVVPTSESTMPTAEVTPIPVSPTVVPQIPPVQGSQPQASGGGVVAPVVAPQAVQPPVSPVGAQSPAAIEATSASEIPNTQELPVIPVEPILDGVQKEMSSVLTPASEMLFAPTQQIEPMQVIDTGAMPMAHKMHLKKKHGKVRA